MKWSVSNLIFPQDTRKEESERKKVEKMFSERQRDGKKAEIKSAFTNCIHYV